MAQELRGRQPRTLIKKCNGSENGLNSESPPSNNWCPKPLRSPFFLWQGARKLILSDDFRLLTACFQLHCLVAVLSYMACLATSEDHTCTPSVWFVYCVASDVNDFKSTNIDLVVKVLKATRTTGTNSTIATISWAFFRCSRWNAKYSTILSDYHNNPLAWRMLSSPFYR